MTKIDSSTYKAIKKDKETKSKKKSFSLFAGEKGLYGHISRIRKSRIIMCIILAAFIIIDVVISLAVFKTRKTWFIVFGCLLAIPFARNVVDIMMTLKTKPLSEDLYNKTKEISDSSSRALLYDISITESEGIIFVPCMMIYNNNMICFTPDEKDSSAREKIKKYLSTANAETDKNYRIVVTENIKTFEKEVKKVRDVSDSQEDIEMTEKILSMGF